MAFEFMDVPSSVTRSVFDFFVLSFSRMLDPSNRSARYCHFFSAFSISWLYIVCQGGRDGNPKSGSTQRRILGTDPMYHCADYE